MSFQVHFDQHSMHRLQHLAQLLSPKLQLIVRVKGQAGRNKNLRARTTNNNDDDES